MTYIYIDESGDLGFGGKGSRYFILACVKIDDEKTNIDFRRIPKKIRRISLKKKYKEMAELKFHNSSNQIRVKFLEKVSKLNIEIYVLIVEKRYTNSALIGNLPILYNYLIKILLEKVLKNFDKNKKLDICLDKCMSASQTENFENYIKTEFFYIFRNLPNLKIEHHNSCSDEGLQVLDFICGAFGYKYNTAGLSENSDYYANIIKNKIIIEKNDLFKGQDDKRNITNPI